MDERPALGRSVLVTPRLCTEDDIPWLIELGKKRYGAEWDYRTVENWFRNTVLKQPIIFLQERLENAFCISLLAMLPWTGHTECNVIFICADEHYMWEAFKLLRSSIEWGRQRKCAKWKLSSDTKYDLRGIAKRLGATELEPRFILEYE